MKVYLGADHGGFELKEKIKGWLTEWGYEFEDWGNAQYDENDDYPDFAIKVAENVAKYPESRGVLVCRSGAGMVICANKVKRIRAAAPFDVVSAKHSREHNDANVIAISADFMSEEAAKDMLKVWLETPFSNEERHQRRIDKIKKYEDMIYD